MIIDKILRSHLRNSSNFMAVRGVSYEYHHKSTNQRAYLLLPAVIAGSAFAFNSKERAEERVKAKSSNRDTVYTADEVSKHNTLESIWVTYKGHVYDVTDFVQSHPGGSTNILLAAGKDLAPFWNIYQQHQTEMVLGILSQYKIGVLKEGASNSPVDMTNPYWNEPSRHPAIKVNKLAPFNGEPPPSLLTLSFITPNDIHFIRNRLPVPDINIEDFKFTLEIGDKKIAYTLDELKSKFETVDMPITLMCAGNRRSEFNAKISEKTVNGLGWGQCAISTSRWRGIMVADLLAEHGVTYKWAKEQGFVHLQAEGSDEGPDGVGTGSSIPLERALDPSARVMVAFEMNGSEIPRDHGYPLRFIIPGTVGARNIKWLRNLSLSHEESHSPTQRRDYKLFGSNITDPKTIPWEGTPSVQYLPVTSAILQPATNTTVECGESITLSGYAFSGGGNGITRVDISTDGGKTWTQTNIYNENDPYTQRSFAWTLWNFEFEAPEEEGELEICIRATDCNCNSQPDGIDPLWNVRGLLNNSWHRITIQVNLPKED